jgi:transposase
MMAEKRRQSTEEFKREAIRLVTAQGDSVSETARHLGIKAHVLGRWKRACETKGRAAIPGHGRMASAQEALQRWRDEHTRWRMERDIVKKALGFCASGSH